MNRQIKMDIVIALVLTFSIAVVATTLTTSAYAAAGNTNNRGNAAAGLAHNPQTGTGSQAGIALVNSAGFGIAG